MSTPPNPGFVFDAPTLASIGFALSLQPLAYLLSQTLLPSSVSGRTRFLFIWHAYDALTHFFVEGSYLYHCFFSYLQLPVPTSDYPHPASLTPDGVHFLGRADRRYGAWYSSAPTARLWQEYAKADHRWGGADLTVIPLELLTVGIAGPFAAYICYLLYASSKPKATKPQKAALDARMWFIAIMLATGELYGGFMTFAPEWLSGSSQLDTSNPIYVWLYLVFFNILWVFIPFWILWEAWGEVKKAFVAAGSSGWDKSKKK